MGIDLAKLAIVTKAADTKRGLRGAVVSGEVARRSLRWFMWPCGRLDVREAIDRMVLKTTPNQEGSHHD